MTPKKAIEVLKNGGTQEEFLTATRLGIEALKRVLDIRVITAPYLSKLLPGETTE